MGIINFPPSDSSSISHASVVNSGISGEINAVVHNIIGKVSKYNNPSSTLKLQSWLGWVSQERKAHSQSVILAPIFKVSLSQFLVFSWLDSPINLRAILILPKSMINAVSLSDVGIILMVMGWIVPS